MQFKERLPHQDSVAQEMVAYSNTDGGIIIGVNDKTGNLNGLTFQELQHTNQQLVAIASQQVFPAVFILSDTITINGHNLIVITIEEGSNKPYKDRNGTIYKKNGGDNRKVTDTNEILRLIQKSIIVYADEMKVHDTSIDDIDMNKFTKFVMKKYNIPLDEIGLPLHRLLENLRLMQAGTLTLAGLLLFGNCREKYRPLFSIQCIAVYDTVLTGNEFADGEYAFEGTLADIFDNTMAFIKRNIRKIQSGSSFNSLAVPEIPYLVFEEVIVNALIHRDFFINSIIKVFIYTYRIEIISPGTLPNSLTIDNILSGISIPRNPILQSLGQYILPYRGIGTGISRAVKLYPSIEFINSIEEKIFIVIIKRKIINELFF